MARDLFDRLNRETTEYNRSKVDRFNPSTRRNYQTVDFDRLNRETTEYNRRNFHPFGSSTSTAKGKGYYDGRGQYHVE